MTNTIIETEQIVALMKKPESNGYTDCPFHGEAVVVSGN